MSGLTAPQEEVSLIDLDQERSSSNDVGSNVSQFGPVVSPFFFMCQYPRAGELSESIEEDVALQVQFSGRKDPKDGYQPHAVYEGRSSRQWLCFCCESIAISCYTC